MKKYLHRTGFVLLVVFYLFAGINHFANPEFYLPLIPPYIPWAGVVNTLSGLAEIIAAAGLLFASTRRMAVYGILAMLLAFLPAHIWMITENGCLESLCVPEWVAWVRLIVIHPLLMYWAWVCRNFSWSGLPPQ